MQALPNIKRMFQTLNSKVKEMDISKVVGQMTNVTVKEYNSFKQKIKHIKVFGRKES